MSSEESISGVAFLMKQINTEFLTTQADVNGTNEWGSNLIYILSGRRSINPNNLDKYGRFIFVADHTNIRKSGFIYIFRCRDNDMKMSPESGTRRKSSCVQCSTEKEDFRILHASMDSAAPRVLAATKSLMERFDWEPIYLSM